MKSILIAALILPLVAFGTAQFPDRLLYNGKSEEIFSTPLEQYFEELGTRPKWLTEMNTACWRGYLASWEIRDDRLYLQKIVREEHDPQKDDFFEQDITKRIFPNRTLPIEATWFSGVVRLPQGKELEYIHMGFESIYEKDHFLEFENGILTKIRIVSNIPDRSPKSGLRK
jgi:hypothetical protein